MKCEVLVDWLTFSVKIEDPRKVILDYLGMEPDLFQDPGFGLLGYQRILRFGDICVCYEPRENDYFKDMGTCVSMSGKGCRTFETMSKLGQSPFTVLFECLAADEDANISRIDIACDDREGYLDMDEIVRKVQQNEINSRMAKRSVVVSYDGQACNGSTVYIGSPSSDFRVRIYDKALEQGQDGHWIRVEMVIRSNNANGFVDQAVKTGNIGTLAAQVINDKFSFIERDDSNITRCTVCSWWSAFVDELEAVRLFARSVVQHSVERISSWIEDQVGPSLSILFDTFGWPHIFEIALDSRRRLSDKQRSLIADYNSLAGATA